MDCKHNEALTPKARSLRKTMTKEERHLWYDYLRNYPIRFRRQKVFGHYIVDFYCAEAKLVIELDGSHHYDPRTAVYDRQRSAYLESYGLQILRFANNDVMQNFLGVCSRIDQVTQMCRPK